MVASSTLTLAVLAQIQSLSGIPGFSSDGSNRVKSPKSAGKAASNGKNDVMKLAFTDVQMCDTTLYWEAMRPHGVIRDGIETHEAVHRATCEHRPEPVGKKPDTPKSRGDDEVKAYDTSIAFLQRWFADNHCDPDLLRYCHSFTDYR